MINEEFVKFLAKLQKAMNKNPELANQILHEVNAVLKRKRQELMKNGKQVLHEVKMEERMNNEQQTKEEKAG